jgi:predicted secreted hydrolase
MKRLPKLLIGALIATLTTSLLLAVQVFLSGRTGPQVRARLVVPADEVTGFARAEGPRPLEFPADHGPHPDYQTEWWYYTGNLKTEDERHFGYQLTFFRRALVPPAQRQDRPSNWATDQVYMGHFALIDVAGGRYQALERFARGAVGLAGAQAEPYHVWLEDWSVGEVALDVVRLRAAQDDLVIDLLLTDDKGPILQGDGGYSQKGPEPGNASYYYSQTRLASSGTVQVVDEIYQVNGLSWMDHEFSTSALAPDQVGWDWFALQMDDGRELMVFQIRKVDGSVDPFSSGTLVKLDGSTRHLSRDDFEIRVGDTWRSPHSGATYPSQWTVRVPLADLTLDLEPYLADQELNVSYAYWEGAVQISGEHGGDPVRGSGYVEMTGYASSMQEPF